jgi:hypothetical protein
MEIYRNKRDRILSFSWDLSRFKALDATLFYCFDLLWPISINAYITTNCDHPGWLFHFTLFGVGFDISIYDSRHREEIYGKEEK